MNWSWESELKEIMAQITGYNKHYDQVDRFDICVEQATKILASAADEWSKGNPEQPLTKDILKEILDIFHEKHFLNIPFGTGK